MKLKPLIKRMLPTKVNESIGNILVQRRERRLSQLTISDAFDEVYRVGMWRQGTAHSGQGSEGLLADRYAEFVIDYALRNGIRKVVDAGCGDFSIGSRLAPNFDEYLAFDVSPRIIAINKDRYAGLCASGRVTFRFMDMTSTTFPPTELILIRQVLQHLTNGQIQKIQKNIEASIWRRVLITEHVSNPENNQAPNLDLASHTVRTRVALGSGVFIDKPPFSAAANRIAIISGDLPVGGGLPVQLLVCELTREGADGSPT
jgi:hypothetical protein